MSAEQKDKIRRLLLEQYAGFHANQKLVGMEVFHIFDRQGNSLLRLHQFQKHSDPIYKLRYSLRARQDFTYQTGLEIGILKESFRYQFPLFYDGEFVGSYEYGIGFKALARETKQLYGGDYLFLLKKHAIQIAVNQEVVAIRYAEFPLNEKYHVKI